MHAREDIELWSLDGCFPRMEVRLGEGKFGKVRLPYYREMPVAVKQFNEGLLQAEVEHEGNIVSSLNY